MGGRERFEKAVDAAAKMKAPHRKSRAARPSLNAAEFVAALKVLSAEIPQGSPEILDSAFSVADAPLEFVALKIDASPASAGVVAVRLEPTDGLRRLATAARAGDIDRLIVEESGHS